MGMALGNPDEIYPENEGVLGMSAEQLSDFASTPRKGLPKYKNSLRATLAGKNRVVKKVAKGKSKKK
jgi:hypothetical protein